MTENVENTESVPAPVTQPETVKAEELNRQPKKIYILVPLLTIVTLLALGAAGYFGYQNYQMSNQKTVTPPPPDPQIKPTDILDPNADWEIYQDEVYKFTFKYPKTWSLITSEIGNALSSKVKKGMIPYMITVKSDGPNKFSWLDINPEGGHDANVNPRMIQTKTTLAKLEVIQYSFEPDSGFKTYDMGSSIYHEMSVSTMAYSQQDQLLIDQILSTFEFVENDQGNSNNNRFISVPLISTTGWQEVNAGNISLKIPPAATINKVDCLDSYEECYKVAGHLEAPFQNISLTLKTKAYHGGSRRQEADYSNTNITASNYNIQEKLFGTNTALDMYFKCQIEECTALREVVLVVNNKLVHLIDGLSAENQITNTIASSLKSVN